ncbi:MAG: threonylcarbamoyl-AMP synthase [Ktedonobacterales bacterium]|nr:threonylcarbamoyl-AMP synthase [Ktedonobacterales bacterium]
MSGNIPHHATLVLTTTPDGAPSDAITRAAALLHAGGLVAFPTETVYGLGADATNPLAVQRIFTAKERPSSDPLIVHLPDAAQLADVAAEIPPVALALAQRFWPGPLTLIVPRGASIPAIVAAGGDSIGVRVPAHPVARALLRAAGVPVAAPSANRFMHTSPTTAAHVLADLEGRIDCVLDGGPCAIGIESTVLDLMTDPPRLLRPGGVTLEALRELLPTVRGPSPDTTEAAEATGEAGMERMMRAPGQMARHYAPHTPFIVFAGPGPATLAALAAEAHAALARGARVGALLPDEEAAALAYLPIQMARLGPRADLATITRRLYAALRTLDAAGLDVILAHTFEREGLGLALEDRLRRAAGGTLRPVRGV